MRKLSFRLLGLAIVLVCLLPLGAAPEPANACIDVITYATNPATGECREFPNPCVVPQGWIKNYVGCPS